MEFERKRVLVTGSTRGIGRAIAERFAREGARIAVNGRDAARAAAVCHALGDGAMSFLTTFPPSEADFLRTFPPLGVRFSHEHSPPA